MFDVEDIGAGAAIIASDGVRVGAVEAVEGAERIRIRRDGTAGGGTRDFIPLDRVASVDAGVVRLRRTAAEVHGLVNETIPAGEGTR